MTYSPRCNLASILSGYPKRRCRELLIDGVRHQLDQLRFGRAVASGRQGHQLCLLLPDSWDLILRELAAFRDPVFHLMQIVDEILVIGRDRREFPV